LRKINLFFLHATPKGVTTSSAKAEATSKILTKMAEKQISTKHLLGIKDLTPADIHLIFETADQFIEVINRPIKKVPSLRDTTIVNLFFENSTRTRISFELAEKRLSADTLNFSASASSVKKGETLLDTVNNILAMKVDMVVIRHPAPGAPHFLAQKIKANIVNAGDGTHEHPTQALLDAFSIRRQLGEVAGKKVAIFGDILHSRVALSNIYCLKKLGAEVKVCGPPTLIPKHIEKLGVGVEHDVRKTLAWCDVANILRIQLERQDIKFFPSLREYNQHFGITGKLIESLDKQVVIMHPGPINRGVEITSDVADSPNSIILDQVENGVAVRMAVLYLLAARRN
jgi:aspartate carbamoyltransferase catalytic subunit